MRGGQDELRGGQTIDLGDVPLARSGHVRFEVADARGRPLPGCEWWLLLRSPHAAPVVTLRDGRPGADCVLSGADGRSPVLELPTGTIGLARYQHARLGGIPIEPGFAPSSFVVLPGSPDRPQRVVLTVPDPDPATSITGHAVDARSRPAAGLRLGFREPTGVRHDAWIHADGRFVARDLPSDVPLDVDPPEGWHITAPISPARAGASDLHVVLEQVPTLEYQLSIRTRDDRPVTLSGLEIQRFVTADDAGGQPFLRGVVGLGSPYRAPVREDDGSYLLKLHAGRYRAVARCSDPTLPTWNLFDLVVDATHTATTVEWPEPTDWRIRVRQRGTGQPVEGAHLEVRRLVMPGAERSLDRLEVEPLDGMARNHSDLLVLQQTVTDAQGRATLRTGTDLSTGSVVVTGAGFVARAVRLDAVPTSRELLVEVEPAGSVLGTVGPLEILEVFVGPHRMARGRAIRNRSPFDGVYVVLRALDGGPGFSRELDGSGAFRFDSVPPGDWNLSLHGRNGFPATEHPASPVRVTPGEPTPRRFHFDLETLAPGGLRILRPAGTPGLSGRRLTIALHGKADAITGMEPDATEGLLHPLVPGRYRAAITWESATGGRDQRHGYLIEDLPSVVPGSVIDWTLTPPNLGALVLTIVSARDGRPLPDRPVSLEADSEASVPLILRGTTDADGRIRWEHAPGRSLRIRVGAPGARTADHAPIADSFEVRQGTPNTARQIAIP